MFGPHRVSPTAARVCEAQPADGHRLTSTANKARMLRPGTSRRDLSRTLLWPSHIQCCPPQTASLLQCGTFKVLKRRGEGSWRGRLPGEVASNDGAVQHIGMTHGRQAGLPGLTKHWTFAPPPLWISHNTANTAIIPTARCNGTTARPPAHTLPSLPKHRPAPTLSDPWSTIVLFRRRECHPLAGTYWPRSEGGLSGHCGASSSNISFPCLNCFNNCKQPHACTPLNASHTAHTVPHTVYTVHHHR
jgi:hypothetical protein